MEHQHVDCPAGAWPWVKRSEAPPPLLASGKLPPACVAALQKDPSTGAIPWTPAVQVRPPPPPSRPARPPSHENLWRSDAAVLSLCMQPHFVPASLVFHARQRAPLTLRNFPTEHSPLFLT